MSGSNKNLLAATHYDGKPMRVYEVLEILHALPDGVHLTTSEAAVFLRLSVTTLERMRRARMGPSFHQAGDPNDPRNNHPCTYSKRDLVAYQQSNQRTLEQTQLLANVSAFRTLLDTVEDQAFYVGADGLVAGAVERTDLTVVIGRLGAWDISWMPATEAVSRAWSDFSDQEEMANELLAILSATQHSINAGLEATKIGVEISK